MTKLVYGNTSFYVIVMLHYKFALVLLTDKDRQEIVCVNERNGKIKAATLFINKLVKSDNPGWYAKFIDALKDKSEYSDVRIYQ